MPLQIEVSQQDAEEFRLLLNTYAPRLRYTERKAGWFSSVTVFAVDGDEHYLSKASAEIEDLREQVMLRRAW